eukprot:8564799-Alexandrium_andersonii.AAC.1
MSLHVQIVDACLKAKGWLAGWPVACHGACSVGPWASALVREGWVCTAICLGAGRLSSADAISHGS